jgi:ABC-type cobalamin/Fe3+-siderophores transport system ATPase subunit
MGILGILISSIALFQAAKIVILDEPTSGFDLMYSQRFLSKIQSFPLTKVITITEDSPLSLKIVSNLSGIKNS